MDKKSLFKITELKISPRDLVELNNEQKAAMSVASFAVTEINALMRFYIMAHHQITGIDAIDAAITTQANVLLRTLSAKIFEFTAFLNLKDPHNKTKDPSLKKIAATAIEDFEGLKLRPGYRLATYMRNEASNHYRLQPVRKNVPFVAEHADYSLYVAKAQGNGVYPMGEEVVFMARFNRDQRSATSGEEIIELHKEWFDWNIHASQWVRDTHKLYYDELVAPHVKNKRARTVTHWLDPELVGNTTKSKMPVYLREEK